MEYQPQLAIVVAHNDSNQRIDFKFAKDMSLKSASLNGKVAV